MTRTLLFLLAATLPVLAQPAAPVVSPEVSADRKVTFRLRAPAAQKVTVALEGLKPAEMTKDDAGVWSYTSPALEPDIYGYSFNVDGVPTLDPSNRLIKPNYLYRSNEVHVPGDVATTSWEVQDIAHGTLHRHFYKSAIVGDQRDYYVYTPAGYNAKAKTVYPVFYLLHGFSDDASGWSAVGRAHVILDNLIAVGKAKPMIVVMTLGYGSPEILNFTRTQRFDPKIGVTNREKYRDALFAEVMPAIEKDYNVTKDRKLRAIAGLSMGGAESLFVGLNAIDKFAYVGAFSEGGAGPDFAAEYPKLDEKSAAQLKLLWVSCGTEDGLIGANRKLHEWLESKHVKVNYLETPGAHTWMVWRRNLTAFAPLLFADAK